MTNNVLTPAIRIKAAKTLNAVKSLVKSYGQAKVEIVVITETSVEIVVDFQHWLRPETIGDVYDEMRNIILKADTEGHIFSVSAGDHAVGEHFVEAILSGLRPGMPVKAEVFFPTISYEIKWKNVISRK